MGPILKFWYVFLFVYFKDRMLKLDLRLYNIIRNNTKLL